MSEIEIKIARIVIVGAGWWSQGWHIPQLHRNERVAIVAVIEPNPNPSSSMAKLESSNELTRRYGFPVFSSLEDFIPSGIEVDGYLVCTTHATHYDLGCKILRENKHLMLEKPMTIDSNEAAKLSALAKELSFSKFFQINHTANWRPQTIQAVKLVQEDNAIGHVKHVVCHMGSPLRELFESEENSSWIRLPNGEFSGFGWGQLSHTLAWILIVTKLQPIKVFCFMGQSEVTAADIYDAGTILCSNGATISLSGVASIPATINNKQIDNKIYGTLGMLTYSGNDGVPSSGSLQLTCHNGRCEDYSSLGGFLFENTDPEGEGPESLQSFVNACLDEPYWAGASVDLGVNVVLTIDALYRSAKSQRAEAVLV